jgi:hypothetical protein
VSETKAGVPAAVKPTTAVTKSPATDYTKASLSGEMVDGLWTIKLSRALTPRELRVLIRHVQVENRVFVRGRMIRNADE